VNICPGSGHEFPGILFADLHRGNNRFLNEIGYDQVTTGVVPQVLLLHIHTLHGLCKILCIGKSGPALGKLVIDLLLKVLDSSFWACLIEQFGRDQLRESLHLEFFLLIGRRLIPRCPASMTLAGPRKLKAR